MFHESYNFTNIDCNDLFIRARVLFPHTILNVIYHVYKHDTDVCEQDNEVFLIFIVAREYFRGRKIIYVFNTTLICYVKSFKEIADIFGAHNYILFIRFCIGFAETICLIHILMRDFCSVMTSFTYFLLFITAKLLAGADPEKNLTGFQPLIIMVGTHIYMVIFGF